jgi:hypothetical protein
VSAISSWLHKRTNSVEHRTPACSARIDPLEEGMTA